LSVVSSNLGYLGYLDYSPALSPLTGEYPSSASYLGTYSYKELHRPKSSERRSLWICSKNFQSILRLSAGFCSVYWFFCLGDEVLYGYAVLGRVLSIGCW